MKKYGNPFGSNHKAKRTAKAYIADGVGYIPMACGLFALVDQEDFDDVNRFLWTAEGRGRHLYACRRIQRNYKQHLVKMHNYIMNPPEGMVVDHKNRNSLDNRKSNLRVCTPQQNQWNTVKQSRMSKGFFFDKARGKYRATIRVNGIYQNLGEFTSALDASKAYNEKAVELCGEFAWLNPVDDLLLAREAQSAEKCGTKTSTRL